MRFPMLWSNKPRVGASIALAALMTMSVGLEIAGSNAARADGRNPVGEIVFDSNYNLYGTTTRGGVYDQGTIYKRTSTNVFTILHSFNSAMEGAGPTTGLTNPGDGNFYGTTYYGGANSNGTIFKITPTGVFTVLHSFTAAEGLESESTLLTGNDGFLYGTLNNKISDGNHNFHTGAVFKTTLAGVVTILHTFTGTANSGTDGNSPIGTLVRANDGYIYGVTEAGGPSFGGTIYRFNVNGNYSQIAGFSTFDSGPLGPNGGLTYIADTTPAGGTFYGTTYAGGFQNSGSVYKVNAGVVTLLHNFNQSADGTNPVGKLLHASDGLLYGVASEAWFSLPNNGGSAGRVFKFTPQGVMTTIHTFGPDTSTGYSADGSCPEAGLVQGPDGYFYGTTFGDLMSGAAGYGSLYKMNSTGSYFITLHLFN